MEICSRRTSGQAWGGEEALNENIWIAWMVHENCQDYQSRVPHGESQARVLLPWEWSVCWVYRTILVIQSRRTRQIYRQLLLSVNDLFLLVKSLASCSARSLTIIILTILFSVVLCRMKIYEIKKLDAMALGSLTQIPLINRHGHMNGIEKK